LDFYRAGIQLFIVQHVGQVSPTVRAQLEAAILARRVQGHAQSVGSVWDGVDVARLFVAHRFLDQRTGELRPDITTEAAQ
jgi:hypothetical protein